MVVQIEGGPFAPQNHALGGESLMVGAVVDQEGLGEMMDHLERLLGQETACYEPCADYLTMVLRIAGTVSSDVVSEGWRRKLCEWSYEVVDHFGFDRDAVGIALNYLDRYAAAKVLETDETIGRREFQLLAVTCLYMALKIHGETEVSVGQRRKLRIDAFVELSRGFFQVETIEEMEREILSTLKWRVNPPTTTHFVASFISLLPGWDDVNEPQAHTNFISSVLDVAKYLTELSVCVSSFSSSFKASETAYACLLCAIEALDATVSLPYDARVAFEQNVVSGTGLSPNSPAIVKAKVMVRELCPDMFSQVIPEDSTESLETVATLTEGLSINRQSSPVCVVEGANEFRRKRCRSNEDNC